ncbi:MAG: O-antigen ligase family protein [Cyanobacteria bacterium P01_E01_bin.34]
MNLRLPSDRVSSPTHMHNHDSPAPLTIWQWWGQRDTWLLVAMLALPASLALSAVLTLVGSGGAILQTGWRHDRKFHRMLAVATTLLLITTAASGGGDSWVGVLNYLPFLLAFTLVSQVLRSQKRIYRFVWAIGSASIGFSLLGLGQALLGWQGSWSWLGGVLYVGLNNEHAPRPTSAFLSPNSLGIYLVVVLALAWGLWRERQCPVELPRWLQRAIPLLAGGFGAPLLVLSESRNGWLVAVLVLGLGLMIQRQWKWLLGLGTLLCVPIAAAANVGGLRAVVPAAIWQRLADSVQPGSSSYISMVTRWQGWQLATRMSVQKPLTGWGWQSFPEQWNAQVPPPQFPLNHAHNLYLSVMAEGGAIGLVAFAMLWTWVVWRGWQAWHWEIQEGRRGALILGINLALTGYFLAGLLDTPIFEGQLNVVTWMVLAIANSYWLCLREGRAPKPIGPESTSPEFASSGSSSPKDAS